MTSANVASTVFGDSEVERQANLDLFDGSDVNFRHSVDILFATSMTSLQQFHRFSFLDTDSRITMGCHNEAVSKKSRA